LSSYNSWSIRTKISSCFLIIICFLFISTVVIHNQIHARQIEVNLIIGHDHKMTLLTKEIEESVLEIENSVRGYVISGDSLHLEPYLLAKAQLQEYYSQLFAEISSESSGTQRFEVIKNNIESWMLLNVEPLIALKKSNADQELTQFFEDGADLQQVEQIRKQLGAFRENEQLAIDSRLAEQEGNNRSLIAYLYVFAVFFAMISLAISELLSKTILRTLRKATSTIQGIALSSDNMEERLAVTSGDEIGNLARATNLLLDSHQHQYWIQSQTSEFSGMYRGIDDTTELADRFITGVSNLLKGQYGAFYLCVSHNNQSLLLKTASYAGNVEDIGKQSFRIGDGLVGQCAKERNIIRVDQIPDGYITINSGLGASAPRHILLVPVEHHGNLLAVLEIASTEPFNNQQITLLKSLLEPFAAAMEVARARMEINRLYSESQNLNNELQLYAEEMQAQSEELRLQAEELQTANSQLQEQSDYAHAKTVEAVEARTEMQLYAEQLNISSQYKSEFLANMSHELRTPLNSMLVFSQFLRENNNSSLSMEELQYAGYIQDSGNDLLLLINDILDLAKVESGKMDLNPGAVNLTELPQTLEQHFSELAARKGLEFSVRLQPGTPDLMYTDEQRLQQILKNLISNAIKFTSSGKVEVKIQKIVFSLENRELLPFNSEEIIGFSVLDTGLGIAEDKQKLIFESFQQADGTIERTYGGTGLGLSISKQLTALLGGALLLVSKPGEGSVFTLYLPVSASILQQREAAPAAEISLAPPPAPAVAEVPADSAENEVFQGKKVLIVDDDKRNLLALTAPLTHLGMNVFTAESGKACIRILEQEKMDIVLIDIMMPEMNGYEVMDWIRNTLLDTELPVIAVTAKAMMQDRDKSLAAGASDYLSKPVQLEQLYNLMRVWLTKS